MNATVSLKNHIGNFLDGIANAISLEPERRSYVAPRNGAVRDAAAMRKDFVIQKYHSMRMCSFML